MWRKTMILLALLPLAATLWATPYDKFYQDLPMAMDKPSLPQFADNSRSIIEFGAVGNGQTLNTDAFDKAIQWVYAQGGGKVVVPRGLWLTGPIVLKSNINLHLEEGAVILFSGDFGLYPIIEDYEGKSQGYKPQSPLSAYGCENIAITGTGVIDGGGDKWRYRKKGKYTSAEWSSLVASGGVLSPKGDMWFPTQGAMEGHFATSPSQDRASAEKYKVYLRPKMVSLAYCKRVLLQGVTFQNPPNWNVHPICCQDVTIDGITVRSPWSAQNSDGLDLESCNRVLVVNSAFDVGDDAICIKSGKDAPGRQRGVPSQHILIDNCVVYHGHGGFVIGSEMSGGVRCVVARNCTFIGTDVGLRFKSTRGRGGVVEDIYVNDIDMMDIAGSAIIFELYYGRADRNAPVPAVDEGTPLFRKFHFSHIQCNNATKAVDIVGLPEMNVQDITFEHMNMRSSEGVSICWANHLTFANCHIEATNKSAQALQLLEASDIDTRGLTIKK